MKPSIVTTALAFVALGVGLVAWGFVGLIPSPTQIGLGAVALAVGVGLFARLRLAHRLGLAVATGALGLGGWRLYHAITDAHHLGAVKAAAVVAVGLYLFVSLLVVSPQFSRRAAR